MRGRTLRFLLLVGALVLLPPAVAQDLDAGLRAYYEGNYSEALKYIRPLALYGNAAAQTTLGHMYHQGLGVPQDYVQAHMWYKLAGASGDENLSRARDEVVELMTSAQIAEAQRLAREWKPK